MQVKKVRKLQLEVGAKMGSLSATKLDISKSDVLAECKDRRHCEQFEKDFDEGIRCLRGYVAWVIWLKGFDINIYINRYTNIYPPTSYLNLIPALFLSGLVSIYLSMERLHCRALETSLCERRELAQLLNDGSRYYAHQLSDVQLVTEAYRSFASRVKGVKEGLGRFRIPTPPPLPDECPSPTDSEMDMIVSPCHTSPPAAPGAPAHVPPAHEPARRQQKVVIRNCGLLFWGRFCDSSMDNL